MAKRRAKGASSAKKSQRVVAKKSQSKKPSKAVAKRSSKKALAKTPVAKKTPPKQPVAKKPVAKKPVAKKPVAKKPVAKKPVAKKPVAKKPVEKQETVSRLARSALAQKRAIQGTLGPSPLGKDVVDAYMRDVDHPFKAEMEAVRQIILGVSPKLSERIKWNAPSFYVEEDFAAFNPRINEYVHLIVLFPGGRGMDEHGNLLEGKHKDRREAKFYGLDDVAAKKPALERLVRRWLELNAG
jgi:hypothetical protein